MRGIISYAGYVPRHRLDVSEIAAVVQTGGGRGSRAVAGYDEDATSMAVEAARAGLRAVPQAAIDQLLYATAAPAYLDRTNSAAIHAALGLPSSAMAIDMLGSVRSGAGALATAMSGAGTHMVVLSDVRDGMPGGADERGGGDAAAAFIVSEETPAIPVLAELVGQSSATDEVFDRWRVVGSTVSRSWEERFAEGPLASLASEAFTSVLSDADLDATQVDHLVVAGLHPRACGSFAARSGVPRERVVDTRVAAIGNPGVAQAGVLLSDVLDRAEPGEVIALVVVGDGAVAFLVRVTDALPAARQAVSIEEQVASSLPLPYGRFLTWRGMLVPEPPRRPDPAAPAAPPSFRSRAYKYAFQGGRCPACGTINIPASRVCVRCEVIGGQELVALADKLGTVTTFTVDRLAFSPSPPVYGTVIDLDGGGRLVCEMTDVGADGVEVGQRVEMTFRMVGQAQGVRNYFWKARPALHVKDAVSR